MTEELSLKEEWTQQLDELEKIIGKRPADLNAVLFLIGVQELGKGPLPFTKEQKQDLMHIAICKLLSLEGYYELHGHDQEGWPHWQLLRPVPYTNVLVQEQLLKSLIIRYFSES